MSTTLPPLIISSEDHDSLSSLLTVISDETVADYLARELDRATVTSEAEILSRVVTMGRTVTYRDDRDGQSRTVTLVYPKDANIATGAISVTTPIGAALIGLSEGQTITWETRLGNARNLTIEKVGA